MKTFLLLLAWASLGQAWSKKDNQLYQQRRFFELEHNLVVRQEAGGLKNILAQERDLKGCKSLHNGGESIDFLIQCAKFINREDSLGLVTKGRESLLDDLRVLCAKMVLRPQNLAKIIESAAIKGPRWMECQDKVWEQIYLNTYAHFETNPVRSLQLVRLTEKNLGIKSRWAQKTKDFLRSTVKD